MKLLIAFLVFPIFCFAQADSAVLKVPIGQKTGIPSGTMDSLNDLTNKMKSLITWSNVTSKPSTYTAASHTHPWSDIASGKPTTLAGYGITDAAALSHTHVISDISDFGSYVPTTRTINGHALSSNTSVTASDISLGNVNNTSDANKPVSTATQTALDLKQNSLGYTPLNPANNLSEVTAATARTNLGATTTGANIFTLSNPGAIRWLRINADNSVTSRTAAETLSDIGAQASGTYVTGTGTASGTNTGDNAVNSLYSGLVTNQTHTGDATGSTALTVVKINGTSLAGLATGILKNTTGTGVPSIAAQADITALLGAGSITNTMLANAAVANLSGTNTGDQTITLTGDVTGSGTGSFATTIGATKVTNAMLAGSIAASKLVGTDIATTGKITNYNAIATVSNGVPSLVATIDATTQTANISTATLYAVPASGAGMYRVNIYITVTQAATTSSTMPSTTITYTDGNAGTNSHSTTTTATSAGNSVTTTFAQATYILYAKASTNIQYATGSYASSGGTVMQYALRIRVEAL